jgi:mannosyltransferase
MKVIPAASTRNAAEKSDRGPTPSSRPDADGLRTAVGLAIAAAVVVGIVLRFWTKSDLWSDEALTANIANLPLHDLQPALKQDGSPPLFYLLLHFWMRVFGSGDLTIRAMSALFSLATIPLVWFAGRRLDLRRDRLGAPAVDRSTVAWAAVLLLVSSPFAIRYATEARMYSLVMLLAVGGYLAVLRAFDKPTAPRLALVAAITGLLLYTHYWAIALIGVTVAFLVFTALHGERRSAAARTLVAVAVGCATFIPWLPTFVFQRRHTGTPWGNRVSPWKGTSSAILGFGGSTRYLAWGLLLLVMLALFARARDERHLDIDLWTRPGIRPELVAALAALWCGLAMSYVGDSAFEPRYAAIMFPLFVLVAAFGVSVFLNRPLRYGVVALAVVLGFAGSAGNVRDNRTQAAQLASVIKAQAHERDLVVYCPGSSGPDLHRLLPEWKNYQEVTYPDLQGPKLLNWVDYGARSDAVTPQAFAQRILQRAGDRDIWFVWSSGQTGIKDKCERILETVSLYRPHRQRLVEPNLAIYQHAGLVRYWPS